LGGNALMENTPLPELSNEFGADWTLFMQSCLQYNPSKRPTAKMILDFLNGKIEIDTILQHSGLKQSLNTIKIEKTEGKTEKKYTAPPTIKIEKNPNLKDELNSEDKKSKSLLPWFIISISVIILLVLFLLKNNTNNSKIENETTNVKFDSNVINNIDSSASKNDSVSNNQQNKDSLYISKFDSSSKNKENKESFYAFQKIGKQIWMQRNLDVDHFRNGDPIPEAKTPEEWKRCSKQHKPAWCYYNNDPSNGKMYGKLYNWYAVNDSKGIAPYGWHVPDTTEFDILSSYLGNEVSGDRMKSKSGWINNGNGDNSSKFNALPAGNRDEFGEFEDIKEFTGFWTENEYDNNAAYLYELDVEYGDYSYYQDSKSYGYSIRCIKD
jgi:uncharacterized protein (TIGR02145 family)